MSTFTVQAETVVGYGAAVTGKVTVGPQPGKFLAIFVSYRFDVWSQNKTF